MTTIFSHPGPGEREVWSGGGGHPGGRQQHGDQVEVPTQVSTGKESNQFPFSLLSCQGRLNQDIDSFREEEEEGAEEEGRSVLVMAFHPSITDITGNI